MNYHSFAFAVGGFMQLEDFTLTTGNCQGLRVNDGGVFVITAGGVNIQKKKKICLTTP
jgi:hypothetical protein